MTGPLHAGHEKSRIDISSCGVASLTAAEPLPAYSPVSVVQSTMLSNGVADGIGAGLVGDIVVDSWLLADDGELGASLDDVTSAEAAVDVPMSGDRLTPADDVAACPDSDAAQPVIARTAMTRMAAGTARLLMVRIREVRFLSAILGAFMSRTRLEKRWCGQHRG